MTVLSATTRLTNVLSFGFSTDTDRFSVSNLWASHVDLYFEFTLHAIHDDVEVQLSHTRQNGLCCLFISVHPESRIFFQQFFEGDTHFFLISLGLRFDRDVDDRFRESNRLENHRMFQIAQSVTSRG